MNFSLGEKGDKNKAYYDEQCLWNQKKTVPEYKFLHFCFCWFVLFKATMKVGVACLLFITCLITKGLPGDGFSQKNRLYVKESG